MPLSPQHVSTELQRYLSLPPNEADRIAGALPELERFRLGAALRVLARATSASEVFFFAEALVAAKQQGKCNKVVGLFRTHASHEDKVAIAAGWAFSQTFGFGTGGHQEVRHVMHDETMADPGWWEENIGGSPSPLDCNATDEHCPCVVWLRQHPEHIDDAVERVVRHLCDMRHSLVHESWPVFMVSEASDGGFPSSMLDLYPVEFDRELFRTYETGVTFDRFKAIVLGTVRNFLNATYP